MKRAHLVLAFGSLIVLGVAVTAWAQPGGPPGGRGGFGFGMGSNLLRLAQNDAVKKELEIIDDQVKAIDKALEEIRGPRDTNRPDFRNMSEAERTKAFADMRARSEKETKAANAKAAEILLPPQLKRLKEISLQQRGNSALSDPEVQTALGFTPAQKTKLEEVSKANADARSKLMELFRDRDKREEAMKKATALRTESEQKVLAVLTADQKAKFEQMKGAAFKMPERQRGQGGQRGQRGGGNRGNN